MGELIDLGKRRRPARGRPGKGRRHGRRSIGALAGGAVVLVVALGTELGPPLVGCPVKGNISRTTGERIFHVPGQEYYWRTRIDFLSGERWFCSEEAARAAGWRKSMR